MQSTPTASTASSIRDGPPRIGLKSIRRGRSGSTSRRYPANRTSSVRSSESQVEATREQQVGHQEHGRPGGPERIAGEHIGQPVRPEVDARGANGENEQCCARPEESLGPDRAARREQQGEHAVEGDRLRGMTRREGGAIKVPDPERGGGTPLPDERLDDVVEADGTGDGGDDAQPPLP